MRNVPILVRPVDNRFKVWQGFGEIRSETTGLYAEFAGQHPGVDFYMSEGNEIRCSFEGVVVRREWHQGMGNVVGVRNGNIVALYAHLSDFKINLGEIVETSDLIGLSGNTGVATLPDVPHLHFELRDITKPSLKEMVFEPVFGKPIKQWKEAFTYQINNQNTVKTWRFLALRYLGDESRWTEINDVNPRLKKLKDGTRIIIPNYDLD